MTEQTAQLIKCLLYKHEDLGRYPATQAKGQERCALLVIPVLWRLRQENPWGSLASLAQLASSWTVRNGASKTSWTVQLEQPKVDLWPPNACTHICLNTYRTHTHPHATHVRGENWHVCDLWNEAKITVANSTRTVLAKIHPSLRKYLLNICGRHHTARDHQIRVTQPGIRTFGVCHDSM